MMRYLVLVGVCLLAYCMYIPLPENYDEPWMTRYIMLKKSITNARLVLQSYLAGYDHPLILVQENQAKERSRLRCVAYPGVKVTDHTFDGVPVRVYDPERRSASSAAVVYYHGGGWVLGNVDEYDCFVNRMAVKSGLLYISVDYRLAPQYVYPIAVDDCVAATKYVMNHAASFGVDPKRIAVAGDSAGGYLSAVVSLKLRDEAFPIQPAAQIMIYPVTQAMDFNTPSYRLYGNYATLSTDLMLAFWALFLNGTTSSIKSVRHKSHVPAEMYTKYRRRCDPFSLIPKTYLGLSSDQADKKAHSEVADAYFEAWLSDPYVSPLLAENLRGLPKSYVMTSEADVLRDDGLMYVTRLREAGNDVVHSHFYSSFHGIISGLKQMSGDLKVKETMLQDVLDYMEREL